MGYLSAALYSGFSDYGIKDGELNLYIIRPGSNDILVSYENNELTYDAIEHFQ